MAIGYCLDAACASTLYALKLAMDDLTTDRASTVICGGVLRADGLYPQMGFFAVCELCLPAAAACLSLKMLMGCSSVKGGRYLCAQNASTLLLLMATTFTVLSVLSELSNDTHGNILAPDCEGQLQAMHAAYHVSGLSPADIDYIECHATGAPRGDAVEINSLTKLFAHHTTNQPCTLGTVKGNIGHLLTAQQAQQA